MENDPYCSDAVSNGTVLPRAFAGEWHEDMNGWWYENDDGSYCRNGWYWIDGDHDGWAQCYYFGNSGYLQMNAGYAQTNTSHADGYEIDKNGAWSVNGVTQVKAVPIASRRTIRRR